jgi:membrane-bound ClpP family serine protease
MLLGIILLFYEMYFIPGTSVIGVIGGILCIFSIVLIFRRFGNLAGYLSIFLTFLVVFFLIIFGARNKVWQRISNRNIISSKSNIVEQDEIKPGQTGYAVTAIRPTGTARFKDLNYIVQTDGADISKGSPVQVVKVIVTRIIVKQIEDNA